MRRLLLLRKKSKRFWLLRLRTESQCFRSRPIRSLPTLKMNMITEQRPLKSGFGPRTTAEEALANRDLRGKVAIVTGGHAGLGLETTRVLSNAGATVVIGSRDPQKAQRAVAEMKNVEVVQLDLASPTSIDRFASGFLGSNRALDLLINNAGIMATPLMRDDRGYEMQFATNHCS